jgi:hypothetical protein
MIRIHRWAAVALLALVTAGCAGTQSGTGVVAAPSPAGSVASSDTVPPTAAAITEPSTTAPTSPVPAASAASPSASLAPGTPTATHVLPPPVGVAAGTAAFGVCPDAAASGEQVVAQCLGQSLSTFWTDRLGVSVGHQVVVDAAAQQVPAPCRSALTAAPAFTCQVNNVVYLNPSLTTLLDDHFSRADRPYAIAVVLAHEFGHVVQADVEQAGYGDSSQTASQRIEQQADCLSGVWANQQSAAGHLDSTTFAAVERTLVAAISDRAEMDSHGTPQQRASALATGLVSGRQQDCALISNAT